VKVLVAEEEAEQEEQEEVLVLVEKFEEGEEGEWRGCLSATIKRQRKRHQHSLLAVVTTRSEAHQH